MEGLFRETEVAVAHGLLRESVGDQLPIGTDPEKPYKAKWQHDTVFTLVTNEAPGAVGDTKQHSQQGELVGGGLLILKDNVPE